jgi:CubicO group peptidase (beta-lactamase class C family)
MDLQQQLAQWPVGAAAIAVIGPDGVLEEARTGAATVDTVYRWASVTKIPTALTVLDAVLDGVISLDDAAGPPGATVRHLLAHASGVRMEAGDGDRPLAAPGTRRIYSNPGIELAADHLAAATGRPFIDELTDRVLDPLGMTGALLTGSPAHGMRSPLADLARLGRELLHSTHLLPGAVAAVSTLAFPGLAGVLPGYGRQEHNDWGLGCEIRNGKTPHWTAAGNAPATFGHFGQSGSFLWVDPDAGLACASLSDTPFGPWAAEHWPSTAQLVLDRHG